MAKAHQFEDPLPAIQQDEDCSSSPILAWSTVAIGLLRMVLTDPSVQRLDDLEDPPD